MVVRAAVTVADTRRGLGAHPAAAARMIEIVAFPGVHDPSIAGAGERLKYAEDVFLGRSFTRKRSGVEAVNKGAAFGEELGNRRA